ncbi:MAG: helix-hairpin-helix domain-containing protein [Methanomicrobiales archaeon]|nr:helix-hairpin-helix domain-containing protein [Methanomicrobiales archaeon]
MFSASLERLGEAWRERLDAVPEYQVVPDGDMFRTSFLESFLFTSEYRNAQALNARLLEEHRGTTPKDLFSGDDVETPCGPAFRIRSTHPLEMQLPSPSDVKAHLHTDLTMVEGIGPATERLLRARGYGSIRDLLPHRLPGELVRRVREMCASPGQE